MKEKRRGKSQWIIMGILEILIGILLLVNPVYFTAGIVIAAGILLIQTILNVLGTVDILPFTGVTFPFVSNGGTSMVASWGLLAFVKAADTRQNASFAVKLSRKVRKK